MRLLKITKSYRRWVYDYEITTQYNLRHPEHYAKPSTLERRLRELRESAKLKGGKIMERRRGRKISLTRYMAA